VKNNRTKLACRSQALIYESFATRSGKQEPAAGKNQNQNIDRRNYRFGPYNLLDVHPVLFFNPLQNVTTAISIGAGTGAKASIRRQARTTFGSGSV
jgi:hypothetical protein